MNTLCMRLGQLGAKEGSKLFDSIGIPSEFQITSGGPKEGLFMQKLGIMGIN